MSLPLGPNQPLPHEENSTGFSQRAKSFLWHEVQISCPVSMTSQGTVEGPHTLLQCQQSRVHISGFLLIWGESLFLVFLT